MRLSRFAVFASGGGTNFQALIDGVESGQIQAKIVCLIAGRPGIFAIERAERSGIPVKVICKRDYADEEKFDIAVCDALLSYGAEFAVLAGYLNIIGKKTVSTFRNRIINIHPALIPSFCGMGFYGDRVHRAVMDAGVKLTGVTVHFVDEGADTGPIILQETVSVFFEDTVEDIAERVLKKEHEMLPRAVALMADGKLFVDGRKVKILE